MHIRYEDLKNTTKKIMAIAFDMDGTLIPSKDSIEDRPDGMDFKAYFFEHSSPSSTMYEWFIDYHKLMFEDLLETTKAAECSIVFITLYTKRSSFESDKFACYINNSISLVYILLMTQNYLQSQLPHVKVIIDPLMIADIAGNKLNGGEKKAGDSFKLIAKNIIEDEKVPPEHHSTSFPDADKNSWTYVLAHRLASLYPKASLNLFVLEDEEKILYTTKTAIQQYYSKVFPKTLPIHLIQYLRKTKTIKHYASVQGAGEIDLLYDWSARFIFFNFLLVQHDFDAFKVLLSNQSTDAEKIAYIKKLHTTENFYTFGNNSHCPCLELLPSSELLKFRETMKTSDLHNTLGPPVYDEMSSFITEKSFTKIGMKHPVLSNKGHHKAWMVAGGALGAGIAMYSLPLAALFFASGIGITKGLPLLKEKCQRKPAGP